MPVPRGAGAQAGWLLGAALAAALAGATSSRGSGFSCAPAGARGGCSGHGVCGADGRCACDALYEGERCDIWRAPALQEQLRDVQWENCTHGRRPGGDGGPKNGSSEVMQLCDLHNKTACEAAGAPTVPAPNFTQADCYGRPKEKASNATGFYMSGLCKDYRGIATVIHGMKGAFCARPCATAGALSCSTCKPDCKIANESTGECAFCSGECQTEECGDGKTFPACTAINPCDPQKSKLVCPCTAPNDANGRPVLAKPQCILTGCGCTGTDVQCGSGNRFAGRIDGPQPLCALTCDPDAKVPAGRSNCQEGAVCEPAPGASFSPAGICTFPTDPAGTPHTPGDTKNNTAANASQLPGWTWANYKGSAAAHTCPVPQTPKFACVQSKPNASWGETYCVNVADYQHLFPFPASFGGDSRCFEIDGDLGAGRLRHGQRTLPSLWEGGRTEECIGLF